MPVELKMLAFSSVLGLLQLLAATHLSTAQRGLKWNFSARDQKAADLTGVAGRLDRAFKNFMETFPFFAAAALGLVVWKLNDNVSALGSTIYFVARLVYVPVYAMGTPVLRTIIWGISFVGLVMVLSPLILN